MGSNLQIQLQIFHQNGYWSRFMAQTKEDRWPKTTNAQEAKVRTRTTSRQHQDLPKASSHRSSYGRQHEISSASTRPGNFGWATEGISRTTRIVDVVYNATSN